MADSFVIDKLPLHTDDDGVVRIGGTRVTLDTVVYAFEQGSTAEEIVQRYSTLSLSDVYVSIRYYLQHQAEIPSYIEERRERADRIKQANMKRSQQHTIRERLLARQAGSKAA
jgi:uncharacterized protein (DUF433 family)